MDSSTVLPIEKIKVTIDRGDEEAEGEFVILQFTDLDNLAVILSDSTTDDITDLFNKVFDYISSKKTLIEFELDDIENDLYNHVSQDVLDQLNAEIKDSEENFKEVWTLVADR